MEKSSGFFEIEFIGPVARKQPASVRLPLRSWPGCASEAMNNEEDLRFVMALQPHGCEVTETKCGREFHEVEDGNRDRILSRRYDSISFRAS